MIVSGGENVYPAEVESVMTGHPAVAEVAVVGVPSADWGESPQRRRRPAPRHAGLARRADQLDQRPPGALQVPGRVSFAPALARTASGKLQKQAIRSSIGSLPAP